MSHLNLYVVNEFESNGEKRKMYTRVGTVFPHVKGEGMNVQIIDGINVNGELVAFPPKARDENGNPVEG